MTHITIGEEEVIIDDIRKGLEAALADVESFETADLNDIKLNKLLYLAIKWADKPVQHSWHLYGPDIGRVAPEAHTIQPTTLSELPSPDTPSVCVGQPDQQYSPKNYQYFFTNHIDIEDVLTADTLDFLEDFYSEHAEKFQELYLVNIELQRWLDTDAEQLIATEINEKDCIKLGQIVSQLHRELLKHEEFTDVIDPIMDYTDLLEDVYMVLADVEDEDRLRGDPRYAIKELQNFYHKYTWKYVAEVISRETATGNNKHELKRGADEELQFLDGAYDELLAATEAQCAKAGVVPGHTDYEIDLDSESVGVFEEIESFYTGI